MNKLRIVLLVLIFPVLTVACGKSTQPGSGDDKTDFRVLGYLFSRDNWQVSMTAVDFSRITDLNVAFVNPDINGNFVDNDAYRQVVEKAHNHGVRVYFSIGGGDPPPHLAALLENDKRPGLISGIAAFAEKYHFDGVDVDLENSLINANYAAFVSELAAIVKPKKLLLTAALASWNGNQISDATLQLYDFINVMSYDKTGPWNPSNAGPHSPYSMLQDDFNYYTVTRKIPAERLLMGLPFYGYGFGNGAPESLSYRDIVSTYPGSENQDALTLPAGGTIYYNGTNTIRQKTAFARDNKAAGVMIWQLLGDAEGDKALLKVINEEKMK